MKERQYWRLLSLAVILAMLVTFVPASLVSAQEPTTPSVNKLDLRKQPPPILESEDWVSPELASSKIDPALQDLAEKGGKEIVSLYVSVQPGTDLSAYLSRMLVRPPVFGGTQNVYGQTTASNLNKIARMPGVMALVAMGPELRTTPFDKEAEDAPPAADTRGRLESLRASEVTWTETQAGADDAGARGWFDVLDGHKSKEAWNKGFDGSGVIVGVMDDGIDFAHPDLQGTYARVTDPTSPYYGWPMAYSDLSNYWFAIDVYLGYNFIASGAAGSRWSDTSTTVQPASGNQVNYQPLGSATPRTFTVPTTSLSGDYKIGSHPDKNLLAVFGERVAILVVDENDAGAYDTVYVDLDHDYSFVDEKPVTQASPEVYRDMDGDGYADISGGALVWISDGANPPPTADWLWGITCGAEVGSQKACPDSGELLILTGAFDSGYTHGTQCASNIAGQGVVNDGLTAQPFRVGGMVQGAAPNVGLMDFGNHYYTGSDENDFLVAALGYDGIPNSGDEVQITSNSYGNFEQMWGSWGYFGRLITALNLTVAPTTVWIFSAGNEGPGYGPQEGDGGPTTIQTGSSTQYGSTNWDSIASADQIVYGDPSSFFSKGPNRDATSGLDVLANGGRGAGDEGLNYYGFNGAESWATWGGTSRSGPVAAGNLALVYQAYKARFGEWPSWNVAKALLKSGATNSVSSPFFQGAGVVNADRATDLAAGIYGIYATPDEWQVGDWQGTEYLNFAHVAQPGGVYNKTYTVKNPSGYPITVGLSDGVMQLVDKTELSFTTSDSSLESGFNFHSPDYLMKLDESLIPADTEVMVVRYVHPYSTFDAAYDYTPNANSSWRFLVYNWTDLNGDGDLWVDQNSNGVVNHTGSGQYDNDGLERLDFTNSEIQEGEYVRMDYEFGGLAIPVIIHNPLDRMADGYYFGWQHRHNDGSINQTTFKIGVEFYKRADWDWLTLSTDSLAVPPEGQAAFNAQVSVPGDVAPGAYEGVIFMNDPGDALHATHETALPVVVNVIADLPDGGAVTLGGEALANTLYQNSHMFGYFNWYGGGWTGAGDWRHYFLNIDDEDLARKNLLVHTSWQETPTDINTWVLGPTPDCASNGVGACALFGLDQLLTNPMYPIPPGQPDPSVFGDYTLEPIGWSDPFLAGAAYPFHTSTGGPDDWLKVPLESDGLHAIALHNVLYNGNELTEPFQVDVGTIDFGVSMDPLDGVATVGSVDAVAYTETGSIDLWFTPTLAIPDLEVTLAGGLSSYQEAHVTNIANSGQCDDGPWCAETVWTPIVVDQYGATELTVYVHVPSGEDIDLFVYYDANDNGSPDPGTDILVGASTNPAGEDDFVVLSNPPLGTYLVAILGWDLTAATLDAQWDHEVVYPGGLPTQEFEVFSDTLDISQDDPVDPSTSSFSTTVTADHRAAALNVALTEIRSGADIDIYVTDMPTGTIVAQSQNRGTDDEFVRIESPAGEYRFAEGTQYTIWVHGYQVPGGPGAQPHLRIWWDQLNLWLTAKHPDVEVHAIGAGEAVSATLHFDKTGWAPGDPDLSARLLASPSVLPGAFDELVIIERGDPPGPPVWDLGSLDVSYTVESGRGPAPVRWRLGGVPVSTALAQGGEVVTWTLTITNNDPILDSDVLWLSAEVDNYGQNYFFGEPYYLQTDPTIVVSPTSAFVYGYDPTYATMDWIVELAPGASDTMVFTATTDAGMLPDTDHLSLIWEWIATGGSTIAGADVRYLTAENPAAFDDSKVSTPDVVLPGDQFVYSVHLEQYNSIGMRPIIFSDPLPAEVEFVSVTPPATYDAGARTVIWSDTLYAGDVVDFDITVQAKDDLAFGTLIENEAMIADKIGGDPVEYLYAYTYIGSGAYLEIEKTVDKLTGEVDDVLAYTIVLHNAGFEAAKNAILTDPVPEYVDVMTGTITASEGAVQYTDGDILWQGNLGPGSQLTIGFQATINDLATKDLALINPAWSTADNHPWRVFDSALTEILFIPKIPDITVDPVTLDAMLNTGASTAVSLTVGNTGNGDLTWALAENPAVDWLAQDPISGTVTPAASEEVTVTFDATGLSAGIYTTTLDITSDDPDEPVVQVPVTLTVQAAALTVDPVALELTLFEGMTDTLPLVVGNTGDADLMWDLAEITAADWLSQDPISGTITPAGQTTVTVTFDSTGLTTWETYTTTLRVSSDAPDVPFVDVPVTLNVRGYRVYMPTIYK